MGETSMLTAVAEETLRLVSAAYLRERSVFLVGKALGDQESLRATLAKELRKSRKVRLYYPELMFPDLIRLAEFDLLTLENVLAETVDAIVICPESPGSFAELGAFANHRLLSERLIVLMNERYYKARSFVRLGPVRFLERKKRPRRVIWYNAGEAGKSTSHLVKKVLYAIRQVSRHSTKETDLKNLLLLQQYLLAFFYVFGATSQRALVHIVARLRGEAPEDAFPIVRGVMMLHLRGSTLRRVEDGYDITPNGVEQLFRRYGGNDRHLIGRFDKLRVEALTARLRRRKMFPGDRRSSLSAAPTA